MSSTNNASIEEDFQEAESRGAQKFLALFTQAKSTITYIFSVLALNLLIGLAFQAEITVVTLLFLIVWIILNEFLSFSLTGRWTYQKHRQWFVIVQMLADFVSTLGIFLVFQLILDNVTKIWQQGGLNTSETVVIIFVVISFVISLFVIYSDIYETKVKAK